MCNRLGLRYRRLDAWSAADDNATALGLAAEACLDAVLLNCQRESDNAGLVTALRILQPDADILMFSGCCGAPCDQLYFADPCLQKGLAPSTLLPLLEPCYAGADTGCAGQSQPDG